MSDQISKTKTQFCPTKIFAFYLIVVTTTLLVYLTQMRPQNLNIMHYLKYTCFFNITFFLVGFLVVYLALRYLTTQISIFAYAVGPFIIIMHQIFIYFPVILMLQTLGLFVFSMTFLKGLPLSSQFIAHGLENLKKRFLPLFCVYALTYTILCVVSFLILYMPDFLLLYGLSGYIVFFLTIVVLYYNYRIGVCFFSYVCSDVLITSVFNRQVTFKNQIYVAFNNLTGSFRAVNCIVFHPKAFTDLVSLKKSALGCCYMILGSISNNTPILMFSENIYDILLMATYKICKCNHLYFAKFTRQNHFFNNYKDPSYMFFNMKWILIGVLGCYFQVFKMPDYFPSNFIVDKDMQNRLFGFYCGMLGVAMFFEAFDASWKSLIVAYAEDPDAVLEYDPLVHKFLSSFPA